MHEVRGTLDVRLPIEARGACVTVGTFDGVHLGHQAVLSLLCARAAAAGRATVAVTFDPHPLEIVAPERAPRLLNDVEERVSALSAAGVDFIVVLPFTPELRSYEPERFVSEMLVERCCAGDLVIGHDHGFGRGRAGDEALLTQMSAECGFDLKIVDAVQCDGGPVSSSRIRWLVEDGRVEEAGRLLGRPYPLGGVVVHGEGRGSGLDYPTANLQVRSAQKLLPGHGIYVVGARVDGGAKPTYGLMHLGPRPTFADPRPTIEVWLMDFEGDLYGRTLQVDVLHRLRGLERFESAQELTRAMQQDEMDGREWLAQTAGSR